MNKINKTRVTSYPYISGDTFAIKCDYIIDRPEAITELKSCDNLFIEIGFIEQKTYQNIFFETARFHRFKNIIFHNGDKRLPNDFLKKVSELCEMVFVTNITYESQKIRFIPIGLENAHYGRNGLAEKYDFYTEKNNILFNAFNVRTNIYERLPLYLMLKLFDKSFSHDLTPDEYLLQLKSSMFTFSPQGNGLDCHRTWEACVVDTVPIIKVRTLPSFYAKNFRMLEVGSFLTFIMKEEKQMKKIYRDVMLKSDEINYFDFWWDSING